MSESRGNSPPRSRDSASPLRVLAVQSRAHADEGCAVGTNVVLVGAELAAFRSDTLQLLLGRSVGIANVHEEALLANAGTVELVNNIITNVASLETSNNVSHMVQAR